MTPLVEMAVENPVNCYYVLHSWGADLQYDKSHIILGCYSKIKICGDIIKAELSLAWPTAEACVAVT
jgi:hypothetical protein